MDATDGEDGVFVGGIWSEKFFDKCGFYLVIGIDKTYKVAGGKRKAGISSGGLTLVFLVNYSDARVFFCIVFGKVTRIIGRPVIDENDFEIFVSLIKNTV